MRQKKNPGTPRDGRCVDVEFDPLDIGIALAMRDNGFNQSQIINVLGYLPDLEITVQELEKYEQDLSAPVGSSRQRHVD